jgi:hypothetical protein
MVSRDECLRYAAECEMMSSTAHAHENRERLTEIAATWRELAQRAALEKEGSE